MSLQREQKGVIVIERGGEKTTHPFFEGLNLIGRAAKKVHIHINSEDVSKIHAKLVCEKNSISIADNKSKNGVFLNDFQHPLEPEKPVTVDPFSDIILVSEFRCKL